MKIKIELDIDPKKIDISSRKISSESISKMKIDLYPGFRDKIFPGLRAWVGNLLK